MTVQRKWPIRIAGPDPVALRRLVRPANLVAVPAALGSMLALAVITSPPRTGPFGAGDLRRAALLAMHVLRPLPGDMQRLDVVVTGASAGRIDRADVARVNTLAMFSTTRYGSATSDGAFGALIPRREVAFNTTDGTFRVDGGPWRGGAWLNAGPRYHRPIDPVQYQCIRFYPFSRISIGPDLRVTVTGRHALALVAQGDIVIAANLPLDGRPGRAGTLFSRRGGGGGGALLLASNHGRIVLGGMLDVRGGVTRDREVAGDGAAGPGGTPGGNGLYKWATPGMRVRPRPVLPGAASGGTGAGYGRNASGGAGGAVLLAAPGGVEISGRLFLGTGAGAVFGPLRVRGALDRPTAQGPADPYACQARNQVNLYPYTAWSEMPPQRLYLYGGGGAGSFAP